MKFGFKYFCPVVSLVIFFCCIVSAQNNLAAAPIDGGVKLTWRAGSEAGVTKYEIYRSPVTTENFMWVATISPKGDNSDYEFIDNPLYRSNENGLRYKVIVVNLDPSKSYEMTVTTSNIASVAKRTWGSIKAMFR